MDYSKQLEEGSIGRLLIKFSIPAIVGMVVGALYNIVDRIFVGRGVGSLAIAGTTVVFPIMLIIMAFSLLVGMGASSLISIRLGEKRKEDAELIAGNALLLLIIISFALSIPGLLFITPLLQLFGASNDVLPYASDYLRIILLGAVLFGISLGLNNFIRAEGNPRTAMYTMLIGAVANIILDYCFIFMLGLGIKGAALATVIAQGISAVWVLHYFLWGRSFLKIRWRNLKPEPLVIRQIFIMGFPPFAMQLVDSVKQVVLLKSLGIYGGDPAISAMGIIFSVSTILVMPVIGISHGAQPIIGYNYGAGHRKRIKETLKSAIAASTLILSVGFVFTRLFPEAIIGLFVKNDMQLVTLGCHGLLTVFLFLPVVGFQVVGSIYFQSVGKPKQATILTLSRYILIYIPALLILPHFWGLEGVWRAAPFADLGSFILTGILLFYEFKRLDSKAETLQGSMPVNYFKVKRSR
ncbi:MAG: MATE family efflux transporter [Syntrophomonas sp.]